MSAINEVLLKELKKPANARKHYNLTKHQEYPKISSGSLLFDHKIGGGFEPGVITTVGAAESGKTSFCLQCVSEFLKEPNRKALYVKSEGRLSRDLMDRSEIEFVFEIEKWTDNTCFVLKSNDYDLFVTFLKTIIDGGGDCKFAIVVDSLNGLRSDNERMCGTAIITSDMLQNYTIHITERGHYCFYISQRRSTFRDKYETREDRQPVNVSGGFSLTHYSNYLLEFAATDQKNNQLMRGDEIVGHNCLIKLRKTTNETTGQRIDYPVRHNVKKGSAVWLERELLSFFKMFDLLTREGAKSFEWSKYATDFNAKLGMDVPAKFRTEDAFVDYLENNKEFTLAWRKELQESFINVQEI